MKKRKSLIAIVLVLAVALTGIVVFFSTRTKNKAPLQLTNGSTIPVEKYDKGEEATLSVWVRDVNLDDMSVTELIKQGESGLSILAKEYNLSETAQKEIKKNAKNFAILNVQLEVDNKTDKPLILYRVQDSAQQPAGFALSTKERGKLELIGNEKGSMFFDVLVDLHVMSTHTTDLANALDVLLVDVVFAPEASDTLFLIPAVDKK